MKQPDTIRGVTGTSSMTGDIVPGNEVEHNIPQVAGDLSLDTGLEGMALKGDQTSINNDLVMISSDDKWMLRTCLD